jgi:hypothetical protein
MHCKVVTRWLATCSKTEIVMPVVTASAVVCTNANSCDPWSVGAAQVWATYSPVKNSPDDARAKAAEGNPTHSATTGEEGQDSRGCCVALAHYPKLSRASELGCPMGSTRWKGCQ